MSSHSNLDEPDYWRKRAKEVRDLAEQISNLGVRNEILQMAEDYELLAVSAEERASRSRS
jgi:hypothetical protein